MFQIPRSQMQKTEKKKKKEERERERLNAGNNNGQLRIANTNLGGARKAAWANVSNSIWGVFFGTPWILNIIPLLKTSLLICVLCTGRIQ